MARLNVNPTRMVLASLKTRLATAKRGHKLLKDKQDELMRQFINLAKENRRLRQEVEGDLEQAFAAFSLAGAFMTPQAMESALLGSNKKIGVDVTEENVMSVRIPSFKFSGLEEKDSNIYPYGYVHTSTELDSALEKLNDVLSRLLDLARTEKSVQLMAKEIESTRRRVNALEYRTIPDLEETIRYIRMKLEEEDRATITRLLKVKDMISQVKDGGERTIDVILQTNQ